jgi:transcription initiation factor IIF auxiliary subunit
MSTDFELFPGKNLSGLFEDIYNNQINKKKHISEVIHELRKNIRHAGDMAVIGPIIKDLIDTSVRNDDQLVKLATIAQRIMLANNKSEGDSGFLTDAEREQLLAEIEQVQDEVERIDNIQNEIEEVKQKIGK